MVVVAADAGAAAVVAVAVAVALVRPGTLTGDLPGRSFFPASVVAAAAEVECCVASL